MIRTPLFRTGYMSILLPVETGEGEVRHIIRESVIHALAATDEWPIRVDVVTSKGRDDGQTKRWFVEYETGPYGQVIDDQPDRPGRIGGPSPSACSSSTADYRSQQLTRTSAFALVGASSDSRSTLVSSSGPLDSSPRDACHLDPRGWRAD